MESGRFMQGIIATVVATLSLICVAVVFVMLGGLYNGDIDNDKIFDIISPAFSTVIGAFVGLLGGLSISKTGCKEKDGK